MKAQVKSTAPAADPNHSAGNEESRELAERLSGSVEVLLLWLPASNTVELRIHDMAMRESSRFRVPSGEAMRAFRHPFAYASAGRSVPLSRRPCRSSCSIHSNGEEGTDNA